MRIGCEAPRRRTHSAQRHQKPWFSPGHRHLEPSSATPSQGAEKAETVRFSLSKPLPSVCGTENDALGHHAIVHEAPQGDEELARQGDDQLLARATSVLGARSKPLGQGAVLLELKEAPRELDHPSPHPSIAGSGESFFPASASTFVRCARETRVARHGAT